MKTTDFKTIREKETCLSIELGTIDSDYYIAINDEIVFRNNQINAQTLYDYMRDKMNELYNHIKKASEHPLVDN